MLYFEPLAAFSEKLTASMYVVNAPFRRVHRFDIGARTTFLKLNTANGESKLLVYAPMPITSESTDLINFLGNGKLDYLVIPDIEHYLAVDAYLEAYPDAHVIGPEPIAKRFPSITTNSWIPSSLAYRKLLPSDIGLTDLDDELEFVYLPGHVNKEIVMYHKPNKALISADLLFNLPATSQFSKSGIATPSNWYSRALNWISSARLDSNLQPWVLSHVFLKVHDGSKKAISIMNAWDIKYIVMCHGEIIQGESAPKIFSHLFKSFL
ncbi:hypothetical protein CANCADRAFT_147570 [Tortispora caseinolytica NRRL Y-17796]|uniref:Metallo-beta-lactamase domain-containing protein n=1 Tax=Tortispora caseinolytica NRRL Y-17796 TaxID=767744 RepID=A0A1E4TKU0_9ASCO|nr:hypothetical protein CANCADRAFT_147570 [Tortispora caseinolytica NRRL Y-17796]